MEPGNGVALGERIEARQALGVSQAPRPADRVPRAARLGVGSPPPCRALRGGRGLAWRVAAEKGPATPGLVPEQRAHPPGRFDGVRPWLDAHASVDSGADQMWARRLYVRADTNGIC